MHRDVSIGLGLFRAASYLTDTGLTVPGRCTGACIRGTLVAVLSIDSVNDGRTWITPPKSRAGLRTVAFPATLVPALREHLDAQSAPIAPRSCSLASRAGCSGEATSAVTPDGLMP